MYGSLRRGLAGLDADGPGVAVEKGPVVAGQLVDDAVRLHEDAYVATELTVRERGHGRVPGGS